MKSCAFAAFAAATISCHRRVEPAVADVLGHGSREEQRLLLDEADLVAERAQREPADVDPVDQDTSCLRVVEAHDEADQRRLARAGWADDRDPLPRRDREADALQRLLARVVRKMDVLEGDGAARPSSGTAFSGSFTSGSVSMSCIDPLSCTSSLLRCPIVPLIDSSG